MADGDHPATRARPATTSFETFVGATAGPLHRTAMLLCGEHHAAEDLLQTTYAKVFASWRRVRRSDNPVAYTRTVLTRTWISQQRLRRSGERPTEVLPEGPAREGDATTRLDLLAALATLDHDDRAVLVLRFYEDLDVRRTADLLRVSEAAVRKRTQRALQRLRLLLPDLTDPEVTR